MLSNKSKETSCPEKQDNSESNCQEKSDSSKFWLLDFIRAFRKLIYITLYGFPKEDTTKYENRK